VSTAGNSLEQLEKPTAICIHLVGPVQPTPHAELLSVVEDILLDDCEEEYLRLTSLHYCDVDFSVTGRYAAPAMVSIDAASPTRVDDDRAQSNAFLDMLSPLTGSGAGWPAVNVGSTSGPHFGGEDPAALCLRECHARFLAFLRNILDTRLTDVQTFNLTRCTFAPMDLGRYLLLPLTGSLRRLRFSQCPLTPAHVETLLQLCRAAGASAGGVPLAGLVELQLCGSLTEECIASVLNYFQNAIPTKPALQVLHLPGMLVHSAKQHAFVESHPYIEVLPLC